MGVLNEKEWAVVDFDGVVEKDLTYNQAQAHLVQNEDSKSMTIVTNDVADRMIDSRREFLHRRFGDAIGFTAVGRVESQCHTGEEEEDGKS